MSLTFEGKNFVILGATSGIGSALAQYLSTLGAQLVLIGRNGTKLTEISTRCITKHQILESDVLSSSFDAELSESLANIKKEWNIDGFNGGVYCAGIGPILPLRGINRTAIENIFAVNYTGAVLFCKVMASKLLRCPIGASIVLIASVSSIKGQKGLGIYGGSKAALVNSVRAFALELATAKVRINCVSPGWLNTDMNSTASSQAAGLLEQMKSDHPLGLGNVHDVNAAIAYLLSDEARWTTGTNMIIDGGFSA